MQENPARRLFLLRGFSADALSRPARVNRTGNSLAYAGEQQIKARHASGNVDRAFGWL